MLQDLLVGVSDACFALRPDTAEKPYLSFTETSLNPFWRSSWLSMIDVAIVGFAYLQSTTDASRIALISNLQDTLTRVGDLAADILGSIPLIIEIEAGNFDSDLHTIGWIVFDEESLRTDQVPDILDADDSSRRLDSYVDDVAEEIGLAIRAEEWRFRFWSRGYLPGIGVYFSFELDSYDSFLPANLNTVPKWQDRLTRIFAKLGNEALSAMAENESVIISVEGFIARDKTFLIIGIEDLLEPAAWEIVYWQ